MPDRIDWSFIEAREGMALAAYIVPGRRNAGVTIAMGFDLGHWSESDLSAARLGPETAALLKPFLGLKGSAAEAALEAFRQEHGGPLRIEVWEADRLNRLARQKIIGPLKRSFDGDLRTGPLRFDDLPGPAQTVLASVAWQYGPNLAARTPKFWDLMTRRDWTEAVRELREFGDKDGRRRRLEADHLETIAI